MPCRLHRLMVLIALIVSIGGHWAFLQTVAWVGMAMDFSQNLPLTVALQKTFSGKNPCQLCLLVTKGKTAQKQQTLEKQDLKSDWCLPAGSLVFWIAPQPVPAWPASALPALRFSSPPTQPPRVA